MTKMTNLMHCVVHHVHATECLWLLSCVGGCTCCWLASPLLPVACNANCKLVFFQWLCQEALHKPDVLIQLLSDHRLLFFFPKKYHLYSLFQRSNRNCKTITDCAADKFHISIAQGHAALAWWPTLECLMLHAAQTSQHATGTLFPPISQSNAHDHQMLCILYKWMCPMIYKQASMCCIIAVQARISPLLQHLLWLAVYHRTWDTCKWHCCCSESRMGRDWCCTWWVHGDDVQPCIFLWYPG